MQTEIDGGKTTVMKMRKDSFFFRLTWRWIYIDDFYITLDRHYLLGGVFESSYAKKVTQVNQICCDIINRFLVNTTICRLEENCRALWIVVGFSKKFYSLYYRYVSKLHRINYKKCEAISLSGLFRVMKRGSEVRQ